MLGVQPNNHKPGVASRSLNNDEPCGPKRWKSNAGLEHFSPIKRRYANIGEHKRTFAHSTALSEFMSFGYPHSLFASLGGIYHKMMGVSINLLANDLKPSGPDPCGSTAVSVAPA